MNHRGTGVRQVEFRPLKLPIRPSNRRMTSFLRQSLPCQRMTGRRKQPLPQTPRHLRLTKRCCRQLPLRLRSRHRRPCGAPRHLSKPLSRSSPWLCLLSLCPGLNRSAAPLSRSFSRPPHSGRPDRGDGCRDRECRHPAHCGTEPASAPVPTPASAPPASATAPVETSSADEDADHPGPRPTVS